MTKIYEFDGVDGQVLPANNQNTLATAGGGGVTSVSITAPITDTGTPTVPNIGISPATALTPGSLAAADFTKLTYVDATQYSPTILSNGGATVISPYGAFSALMIPNSNGGGGRVVMVQGVFYVTVTTPGVGENLTITLPLAPIAGPFGSATLLTGSATIQDHGPVSDTCSAVRANAGTVLATLDINFVTTPNVPVVVSFCYLAGNV